MPGVAQVAIVVCVVVIGVVLWFGLDLLDSPQPSRRGGYLDRSPDGSEKPRWRVRSR